MDWKMGWKMAASASSCVRLRLVAGSSEAPGDSPIRFAPPCSPLLSFAMGGCKVDSQFLTALACHCQHVLQHQVAGMRKLSSERPVVLPCKLVDLILGARRMLPALCLDRTNTMQAFCMKYSLRPRLLHGSRLTVSYSLTCQLEIGSESEDLAHDHSQKELLKITSAVFAAAGAGRFCTSTGTSAG